MAAKWVGALLYAVAAAGAAVGAVSLDGPPSLSAVRETAPLAAVLGAFVGFGVHPRWPRRFDAALATGVLTAVVVLVFFSGLFLVSSAFIEAFLGGSATKAVASASGRLGQHLPIGAALAVGGFSVASLLMWLLGSIGRLLFGSRTGEGSPETGGEPAGSGAG